MSNKYDTIVVGGGHNGLTAATILANHGQKVLLVEKRSIFGGVAAGEEFHPGHWSTGLLQDTGSVRRNVITDLSLEKFGLETNGKRASTAILGKQGKCITISDDETQTAQSINRYSEKDSEAYLTYKNFITKITPFIRDIMDQAPPDLVSMGTGDLWQLAKNGLKLKRLGKATMMEFLKVAPMSVQDFLDERFETDFLKAGMSVPAVQGSFTSPRSAYTTLNLLLWECLSSDEVVGGPQALTSALVKAAQKSGVDLKSDSDVRQVVLDEQRKVKGIRLDNGEEFFANKVAATCAPQEAFFQLLEPNQIEYSLEHGIEHFRSRGTTAKLNLALSKPLRFNGQEDDAMFARTGNSWLEMEKAFDPIKYRNFSSEPILETHNTGKAPEGCATFSILVHYAPFELEGGWTDTARNELTENIIDTLSQYSPEVRDSIVGSELLTPIDLKERYGLPNGHIFHGEHAVDQLLTRPIPSCMQYNTPINGLYLCGSGSHPGGGITCLPGYLGAKRILKT